MKNLSKVLAVVLALAMALSMVSFAAYTDVAAGDNCEEAVTVLSALEILKGYEDGSFKPEATITRAEFATVVIRLLGLADTATSGSAIFTDVAADHWANGAIALAAQQGIVNGYGDGRFGPEDPVKYEEAIKMVVAALGYTPMADANGGYPGGYQVVASQKGILAGISGAKAGQPASRGIVAQLAYNSLTVPLMEQTGYGTQTNFETVDMLLLNKLGVTKFEGKVIGTSASGATKDGKVKVSANWQITAVEKKSNAMKYNTGVTGYVANPSVSTAYFALTGTTIAASAEVEEAAKALLDTAAVLYVKDAATEDAELVCILKDGNRNATVEFMAEDLKANASVDATVVGTLAVYTDKDAGEYEEYDVDINTVYVNGQKKAIETISTINPADALDTDAEYEAVVEFYLQNTKAVDVKLLSNGADEDVYNVAYITVWTDAVVESVSERNWRVYTDNGTYVLDETDVKNQNFTIYKDGEVASFDDIKENDVLSIAGYKAGNVLKYGDVYITSEQVEGTVNGKSTSANEIKVDGETYKTTSTVKSAVKLGDKAVFYVNARGVLVGLDKAATASNLKYGFVTYIYNDANFGEATARILTADGVWTKIDLADKITSVKGDGSNTTDKYTTSAIAWSATDATNIAGIEDTDGGTAGKQPITGTTKYVVNKVAAYELDEAGKIKTLFLVNYNADASNSNEAEFSAAGFTANGAAEYYAATSLLGGYSVDADTIIFSFDSSVNSKVGTATEITANDEKKITVVSAATLTDRTDYDIDYGFNVDADTNVWPVLAGVDVKPGIDWTADFFVVTDTYQTANELGEEGYMLTGLVGGEETTLFLNGEDMVAADVQKVSWTDVGGSDTQDDVNDNTHTNFAVASIAKGDVLIYSLNAKGEAAEVKVLLDASDMIVAAGNNVNYTYLTNGIAADNSGYVGNVEVGGTTYKFVLGYVKDRTNANITIVGGDHSTENVYKFNAETIGAAYDAHITAAGKVTDAVYGDAVTDPHGTKDGDFIFARVTNNVVVEDFVIISNKR